MRPNRQRRTHRPGPGPDRPLLRLFKPDGSPLTTGPVAASGAPDAPYIDPRVGITLRDAHDKYLVPELDDDNASTSTRNDYLRWVDKYEEFHAAEATDNPDDTRTVGPCTVSAIDTASMRAFRSWLEEQGLSASTVRKAMSGIKRIVELSGDDGVEVQNIKARRPAESEMGIRPHYFTDEQIDALWARAAHQQWPQQIGIDPATWWRAVILLLRTYGMRVQDLTAYSKHKEGLLWKSISLHPRTPNPKGRATWSLGWLHYRADKTGRELYLPLTKAARGAIERLITAALTRLGTAGCTAHAPTADQPSFIPPSSGSPDWARLLAMLPPDEPILRCPHGAGRAKHWMALQARAGVDWIDGSFFQLEDFRRTMNSALDQEDRKRLASIIGGWASKDVQDRNYGPDEQLLVHPVHGIATVPLPSCFVEWEVRPPDEDCK